MIGLRDACRQLLDLMATSFLNQHVKSPCRLLRFERAFCWLILMAIAGRLFILLMVLSLTPIKSFSMLSKNMAS